MTPDANALDVKVLAEELRRAIFPNRWRVVSDQYSPPQMIAVFPTREAAEVVAERRRESRFQHFPVRVVDGADPSWVDSIEIALARLLSRLDALEAEVVALRDVAAEAKEWQRLHVLMNHGHPSDATFGEGRCVAKLCAAVRKLLALETRKEE